MAAAVQMSRNVACLIATLALAGRKAAVAEQVVGGEADFQFVNVARHGIRLGPLPGKTAQPAVDELGWPMEDCQVVVFDDRPAFAWAPPMDDPQALQGDYSGLWRVRVVGNATLALGQASGITLVNQSFDAYTNTLTAFLDFAKGTYPKVANLLVLQFSDTFRDATSSIGSGFRDLSVVREKYFDRPDQLFTDEWATFHAPFNHLRFMGVTGTNSYSWLCGAENAYECSVIEWTDRALPSYAYTGGSPPLCRGCVGQAPWEYVVLAANELKKDIWINVPVTASSPTVKGTNTSADPRQTYVYQLALLLRQGNEYTNGVGLDPSLNVYIEHSNEVWNFGFKQYSLNQAAAAYEVLNQTRGRSNLASNSVPWVNCSYDPSGKNAQCWGHRRHVRRVYEISQVFEEVFGKGSLNARVRMVYASWTINPQEYYNNTLTWMDRLKGPVDGYFYALANTGYFGPDASWQKQMAALTPQKIVQLYGEAASNNTNTTRTFAALKQAFGLKYATYEAGPGYDVGKYGSGKALSNLILSSRDAGMKAVVVHACKDIFWANGGDIWHQFSVHGKCSRYGCWGAQEFYNWPTLDPKFQGNLELVGKTWPDVLRSMAQRVPATDPMYGR